MRQLLILLIFVNLLSLAKAQDQITPNQNNTNAQGIPNLDTPNKEKLLDAFLSIVMVRGYSENGGMSYGSGIVVSQDKVLTNCHIFRQTKQPWISRGEDVYQITEFQADRYHDLCLVRAQNLPFKPITLADPMQLRKGLNVVSIGYSNGMNAPLTSLGTVQSIYDFDHGGVVRTNARFVMGASGSGLFDNSGRLLGINTVKTPGNEAYYYSLPLEWLDLVAKQPVESKFPIVGKTFWEEDDTKKPYFMQMAQPELNEDWNKLLAVAQAWTNAEPKNSEAWYELGLANDHLNKTSDAEKAYRQAVTLNAKNTDALFRLGVLASEKGDKAQVHAIQLSLSDIDKDIAASFSKTIGCQSQC